MKVLQIAKEDLVVHDGEISITATYMTQALNPNPNFRHQDLEERQGRGAG